MKHRKNVRLNCALQVDFGSRKQKFSKQIKENVLTSAGDWTHFSV